MVELLDDTQHRLFRWSDLFGQPSSDLIKVLEAVRTQSNLATVDFLTLRDWLDQSGLHGDEPLLVLLLTGLLAHGAGSLCLELSQENLSRRLAEFLEPQEALAWASRIMAALDERDWSALVGRDVAEDRPVLIQDLQGRPHFYFHKHLHHERDFVDLFRLRQEQAAWPSAERLQAMDTVLQETLVQQPSVFGGKPLCLDPDQRLALSLALLRDLAIISGGPGTGKTSIVLTLLRCLVRLGYRADRIVLAAPTGRAAQRLGDSLGAGLAASLPAGQDDGPEATLTLVQATTLHQVLGYHPGTGRFRRHGENPIPADVLVVDEVSMVGLEIMAQLFRAAASSTKIVLLGDKDQLPSVDAGAVLAHLVPSGRPPGYSDLFRSQVQKWFPDLFLPASPPPHDLAAWLRVNHRSQPLVQETAQAVNLQQQDIVDRLNTVSLSQESGLAAALRQGGCHVLAEELTTPRQVKQLLAVWVKEAYFSAPNQQATLADLLKTTGARLDPGDAHLPELFRRLEERRLLTLVREGPWGCVGINRYLDQLLRPQLDPGRRGPLFAGAPVLVLATDHGRQLYNGDVGLALSDGRRGLRVVFPRPGGFVSFPGDTLPECELGFALTVHKSQGSEYGTVGLVFPPEGARGLLTKELVYTAITRARHTVLLCGKKEVMRQAIGRRVQREAGLLKLLLNPE